MIIIFGSLYEISRKYCVIVNSIYVTTNSKSPHENSRKDCIIEKQIMHYQNESFYKKLNQVKRNEFQTLYYNCNSVVEVNIANVHLKISQDLFL